MGIGFCQMLQLCGGRCGSSFMIRFESLGGPVTPDCELHQFFQFFFSPLGGNGWLKVAVIGYFSSSMWKARAGSSWEFPFLQVVLVS